LLPVCCPASNLYSKLFAQLEVAEPSESRLPRRLHTGAGSQAKPLGDEKISDEK